MVTSDDCLTACVSGIGDDGNGDRVVFDGSLLVVGRLSGAGASSSPF